MLTLAEKLAQGVGVLRLAHSIDSGAQQRMICFLQQLKHWNQSYNLTSIQELEEMVSYHLLDSLAILPYLKGQQILDIGTGAGFPGVPLALCLPDHHFVLLDSNGKKVRFLIQAKAELSIKNIEIVQARMEQYRGPEGGFDTIVSRAVGSLAALIAGTQHLTHAHSQWLMMKGIYPQQELKALSQTATIHSLKVPGVIGARHLVVVQRGQEFQ